MNNEEHKDNTSEFPQLWERSKMTFKTFDGMSSFETVYDPFLEYARLWDITGYAYLDFVIDRYYELFHDKYPTEYPDIETTQRIVLNNLYDRNINNRDIVEQFYNQYKYGRN